jgi:ATP-dependent DNA ligase
MVYEAKFDGFRCIAPRGDDVRLQSRQLRPLTAAFPDVVAAVAAVAAADLRALPHREHRARLEQMLGRQPPACAWRRRS